VLSSFLGQYTLTHPLKFGINFASDLFCKIEEKLLDLYYFSLEALRCALDQSYIADFQYSYAIDRRKQEPTKSDVSAKSAQLDALATSLGLQRNLESLKKISSGKWLLSTFCEIAHGTLKELSSYCGAFGSERCEFCRTADSSKCTFRLKKGINSKTLYSAAPELFQITSLNYVKHRLAQISLVTLPWDPLDQAS